MSEFDKVKYNQEYNKKNYKEVKIYMSADKKTLLKKHSKEKGFDSVNAYVNELIRKDMNESTPSISVENYGGNNTVTGDIHVNDK